jgi:DNA-binding NarL/FixJ family response regulator
MPPEPAAHPPTQAVRVIVADDHALFREGLKLLLNMRAGVVVVADTDNLQSLSELLAQHACDVLLLGLGLGIDGLADLGMLSSMTKVVLLCDGEQIENVAAAMRTGVQGAIFKRSSADVLFEAMRAVTSGQMWMPPEIQSRLAEYYHEDPRRQLTRRELDVVRHVAHGQRNAEIAKQLFITEQTVKTHLGHIFHKTGTRDRVELALYAVRLGIVTLSAQPQRR